MSDPAKTAYRGRFAPSPSGPLHAGSLVAAVASYLQARTQGGQWLLRIEDIDPPREVPGAAQQIIGSLERHGFEWDGPILYQSRNLDKYTAVIEQLLARGLAYPCSCSRETIRRTATRTGPTGPIYPGTCRHRKTRSAEQKNVAIRLRSGYGTVKFFDQLRGQIEVSVAATAGDFIIRRKDGLVAYNLAIVVDDADQAITQIVRGQDLFAVTPAQIELQRTLELPSPDYFHVPLVVHEDGQKLSKQTGAAALDDLQPEQNLLSALKFLGHPAPPALQDQNLGSIWAWAIENWSPLKLDAARKISHPVADKLL